jgi:glycosyltransferase involved in cell wall biosynthesis
MPQITVIVPTYNCRRILRCALESLSRQTYRDFEAWIVGDGCTDDSDAVVSAFHDARFHWMNLPSRTGSQSAPNNEGLRRAAGALIAYLGHDDLWLPWHLESLADTVERDGADFTYGGVVLVGPDGPREAYGDAKVGVQASPAPPSGWLHRRTIVDTCGPWRAPDAEPIGVDVGFQARAFLAGFRFTPSRRLSVLKFPSPWWGTYGLRADFPQEAYLSRMTDDAERLHRALLTDLVFAYARRSNAPSVTLGLASAVRAVRRHLGEWYGVERWPLSPYLRWQAARRRKRAQVSRGLRPSPHA